MFVYFRNLLLNKKAQGMVEYVLLVGLIALVVIGVVVLLGPALAARFQGIVNSI